MFEIDIKNKVVFVDWGLYLFQSISSWVRRQTAIPTYLALNSLIADLKKVCIKPEDLVIIAVDSKLGSWRKDVDSNYKNGKKTKREQYCTNWQEQFKKFDKLIENLRVSTPFHILEVDKLEADDIISYGVRYYKDNPCTIVSCDKDIEMLASLPNVVIFSPKTKNYKFVKNPNKILTKKINKEQAVNLLTPITSQSDYENRYTVANLNKLPKEIEGHLDLVFKNLVTGSFNADLIWYPDIREKFYKLYATDKEVTLVDSYRRMRRNKEQAKKKALKEKQLSLE